MHVFALVERSVCNFFHIDAKSLQIRELLMKKKANSKIDSLLVLLFSTAIFLSVGWYMAEADNEILRKELSSHTGQEVRK